MKKMKKKKDNGPSINPLLGPKKPSKEEIEQKKLELMANQGGPTAGGKKKFDPLAFK